MWWPRGTRTEYWTSMLDSTRACCCPKLWVRRQKSRLCVPAFVTWKSMRKGICERWQILAARCAGFPEVAKLLLGAEYHGRVAVLSQALICGASSLSEERERPAWCGGSNRDYNRDNDSKDCKGIQCTSLTSSASATVQSDGTVRHITKRGGVF